MPVSPWNFIAPVYNGAVNTAGAFFSTDMANSAESLGILFVIIVLIGLGLFLANKVFHFY